MKKLALILILLQTTVLYAAKPKPGPNPADYTIAVHVITSGIGSSPYDQRVQVLIDGKQMELEAYSPGKGVLALGDYTAKLSEVQGAPKVPDGHDVVLAYEFLFSDGSTRVFTLIGLGAPAGTPTHP